MSDQTVPASRTVQVEFLPIGRRILSVVRTEDVTPRMRRIVLAGDDLGDDFPCFPMHPNDHVKLCFPDPQSGELVVPRIGERGMELDPDGPQPIFRDYTVRGFDPQTRELTIDFVLHDHGIAGVWAGRARPGDVLGVLGPRGTHHFPTDYRWYLVAGDETALPAIGRWVEELPAGATATVVVEVAGPRGGAAAQRCRRGRAAVGPPRSGGPRCPRTGTARGADPRSRRLVRLRRRGSRSPQADPSLAPPGARAAQGAPRRGRLLEEGHGQPRPPRARRRGRLTVRPLTPPVLPHDGRGLRD